MSVKHKYIILAPWPAMSKLTKMSKYKILTSNWHVEELIAILATKVAHHPPWGGEHLYQQCLCHFVIINMKMVAFAQIVESAIVSKSKG